MIGRVVATSLLFACSLAGASCSLDQRPRTGPLASTVDSLLRDDPVGECRAPERPVHGTKEYRECYSRTGRSAFHIDSTGLILSVALTWLPEAEGLAQADSFAAALDRTATPVPLDIPITRRWKGDSLCHTLVVDSSEMGVLYVRSLREPSDGCRDG
jgi:hypothetical protein